MIPLPKKRETKQIYASFCHLCHVFLVKEERNYDLSRHQVKLKDCKLSHLDELQMSFDKKYNLDKILEHEMISTSLDRASGERNLAGTKNHRSISNQLSSKAGYYSKKTSSLQGILEPNGISSFKKGYSSANVASVPSCCPKISTEISNASFDCKFMPEEKLFKLFPVPKLNPTADLIDTRSKSKVPANYESSSNFNCDNAGQPSGPDIEFQKSDAHPFGTECYFPYSSSTKNFHIDIQMPDSSGRRNAGKDNEDQNRSFEESKNKISIEKNSVSSLSDRSVVAIDCMDKCNENVESKHEDLLDGPKTRNPFEEAGETVLPIKELPLHLQKSCIADKLYLSYGQSPVPSEVIDKEKLGAERSFGRMGGNKTNTSCQVMLESNFLQLRVQKVLMEAPVKDDRRKVQIQVLEQGNRALENLHLSA